MPVVEAKTGGRIMPASGLAATGFLAMGLKSFASIVIVSAVSFFLNVIVAFFVVDCRLPAETNMSFLTLPTYFRKLASS